MADLGSSKVGRELLASSVTYVSATPTQATTQTESVNPTAIAGPSISGETATATTQTLSVVSTTDSKTTTLGTSQLGRTVLGGVVTYISTEPTSVESNEKSLDSTTIVETTTNGVQATTGTETVNPISLSPENLFIEFNEPKGEFQSNWFEKQSPIEEPGKLIIVGNFRDQEFDPVDIIVERDDTGDGFADIRSEVMTLDDSSHVVRFSESDHGEEMPKEGANYRLRFPGYNQTDALDRLTLALGWDSERRFHEDWDLSPVNSEAQPTRALIAVLLSENYRFDATLDQIFDAQHISTSTDKSLEYLSHEVGTSRKENENDLHLRKRTLAKSATRTFSSTGSDVTDLINLIFDENADKVGVGVLADQPVLEIEVPQAVVENHILSQSEIESLLDEAVSSSYNTTVTAI